MTKTPFAILCSILFLNLTVTGYTDHPTIQNISQRPHRIYFGPEFLWVQSNTHIRNVQVDDHGFFWGWRLGYDYIKPQEFYGGIEWLATTSRHSFAFSENGTKHYPSCRQGFGNLEARFGYTFEIGHAMLTPFAGLGVYSLAKFEHEGFKESTGYLSGGIRSSYECAPRCILGLNAEILRNLIVEKSVTVGHEKYKTKLKAWGGKIEAPITVRISQGWDMQIVPSYLRPLFSELQNIYGASLVFGYRF